MKFFIVLLGSISLFAGTTLANTIQSIDLGHRPADEIIPIIRPMLDHGDSLTGQGYRLFIRTSQSNFEQIKQMVNKLDTPPKMLLISVFQGNDRDLRALAVSGSFEYRDRDIDTGLGGSKKPSHPGADIQYSTRNTAVGARTLSTRGRLSDNPVHQLRISEGSEGYIETGKSIPYFSGNFWRDRHHGIVEGGMDYRDINTGFYILPRVHGEQVMLDVSPYKQSESRHRGGEIETQSASTRITGRLGEWLPVGGVTGQTRNTSSRIGHYGSTQSRDNASIWIKADLVE